MNSVIGTWHLVAETATDETGQPRPTLAGPLPLGFITFTAGGRMIVAVSDGRPDPIDGPRGFYSYCGSYTFDGARLITRVDGASDPRLRAAPQVRGAHFDGRPPHPAPVGRVLPGRRSRRTGTDLEPHRLGR